MPARKARTLAAAAAAFILTALTAAPDARALINPNFTPLDLVADSQSIFTVRFGTVKDNRSACAVGEVLKGETPGKTLTLDFSRAINENEAQRMAGFLAASGEEPGICFLGAAGDAGAGGQAPKGFLHVAGAWVQLEGGQGGLWQVTKVDRYMEGCWAGGTDMLLRAVEYILADEDADFPCKAMVSWSRVVKVGSVPGQVTSAAPVDLDGNGKCCLFVTSAAGDRLFQLRGDALQDVTAARDLQSKSLASAWLDGNGDGRIDLAGWDGQALRLHLQGADGRFAAVPAALAEGLPGGCLGLGAIGLEPGTTGLLVATGRGPMLLAAKDGAAKVRKLAEPGGDLGEPAGCMTADFDGDGFADIVQLGSAGSVLYAGKAGGAFAAPVACGIATGKGPSAACTGDFDADGALDVFTTGPEGCEVWQNIGKGRFVPRKRLSGEIAYISKPDGVACQACDVNNDGRQDFFIAYKSMGAQIFFNRGFRSTGHAHELDLTDNGLLRPAEKGQQAGCIGDFNADGAQDMALVLKDGDVHVFYRDIQEGSPLSIHVGLSPKGSCAGPLTVTGWREGRCLGAWNVGRGTPTGFVGLMDAGQRKIKWQLPGGKPREKLLIAEDGPVRFLIQPEAGN